MKRLLFILFLLVLIAAGAAWYVNRRAASDFKDSSAGAPNQSPSTTTFPSLAVDAANDIKEQLRIQSLKIVARPILVKIQLSESSKNQAIGKIQDLVKLIEKKYDYIEAWYDLGAYRKLIGDYDGAIEAYNFVIKIRPKDEIAYVNLGDLYGFYLKDYENSEKNFL